MKRFFRKNNKKLNGKENEGYAVLEVIFYIAFFVLLTLVVMDAMLTMARSFKETTIQADLVQSGNIMERISREIRGAKDIQTISATDLILDTTDTSGAAKTVEFKISGTDLQLFENGVLTGNLNTTDILITGLSFTAITTAQGQGVKITLSLRDVKDTSGASVNFYDSIVLRGEY